MALEPGSSRLGRLSGAERATSIGLVMGSVLSVQVGAAVATTLFDELGPAGAGVLPPRLGALILLAVWRPALPRAARGALRDAVLLWIALAGRGFSLFAAPYRIPPW